MISSLLLSRLHRLRPSLPSNLSTPFAVAIYRLLSTTTPQAPPPNPQFAVGYLIQSCGLPSDVAIRVGKKIQHLKSPDNPDAVLGFLRQTGIGESVIRKAVSREPRLLCCTVEKNLKPNIAKLQEAGFSMEDISGMISKFPDVFVSNFVAKIHFLMRALGSVENLASVLARRATVLGYSLENVIMPNISFLQEQCGFSGHQIVLLFKNSFRLIQIRPELLKIKAKRAEELGVVRKSPQFVYALGVVGCQKQSTIDAKLHLLKSFGFSQEEVNTLIRNGPSLLTKSKENLGSSLQFLMKEVGCHQLDVVRDQRLLNLSLEKRLIPRNAVRVLLMSKGLPAGKRTFSSFMKPTEEQFVKKSVLPYEHAIPGLHQAYADACAGKTAALNSLLASQVDFPASLDTAF